MQFVHICIKMFDLPQALLLPVFQGKLYIINNVFFKGGILGLVVAGKCETDGKVIKNGTKTYLEQTKIN